MVIGTCLKVCINRRLLLNDTQAQTGTHTHLTFDLLMPIARDDDSDVAAEAKATCAGIAPFNSLHG